MPMSLSGAFWQTEMRFITGNRDDFPRLKDFYHRVILQQAYDEYGPGWTEGVYPSDDDLKEHHEKGEFILAEENEEIAAAAVLTFGEEEGYKKGNWQYKASDEWTAIVHLLAVDKTYRGHGMASKLLKYVISRAREKADVIHLDVAYGNLAAARLYEKNGFRHAGTCEIWYSDTGMMKAEFYEYDLKGVCNHGEKI